MNSKYQDIQNNDVNRIEEFINKGKWIKNDIGMGRIQCAKLVKDIKELMVIIVSNTMDTPVSCRVEKIIVIHGEILFFYDGQYVQRVEREERNRYKNFLNEEEWNIIFKDNPIENLDKKNMISKEDRFYVEIHESLETYMHNDYDVEASKFICEKYNL